MNYVASLRISVTVTVDLYSHLPIVSLTNEYVGYFNILSLLSHS